MGGEVNPHAPSIEFQGSLFSLWGGGDGPAHRQSGGRAGGRRGDERLALALLEHDVEISAERGEVAEELRGGNRPTWWSVGTIGGCRLEVTILANGPWTIDFLSPLETLLPR